MPPPPSRSAGPRRARTARRPRRARTRRPRRRSSARRPRRRAGRRASAARARRRRAAAAAGSRRREGRLLLVNTGLLRVGGPSEGRSACTLSSTMSEKRSRARSRRIAPSTSRACTAGREPQVANARARFRAEACNPDRGRLVATRAGRNADQAAERVLREVRGQRLELGGRDARLAEHRARAVGAAAHDEPQRVRRRPPAVGQPEPALLDGRRPRARRPSAAAAVESAVARALTPAVPGRDAGAAAARRSAAAPTTSPAAAPPGESNRRASGARRRRSARPRRRGCGAAAAAAARRRRRARACRTRPSPRAAPSRRRRRRRGSRRACRARRRPPRRGARARAARRRACPPRRRARRARPGRAAARREADQPQPHARLAPSFIGLRQSYGGRSFGERSSAARSGSRPRIFETFALLALRVGALARVGRLVAEDRADVDRRGSGPEGAGAGAHVSPPPPPPPPPRRSSSGASASAPAGVAARVSPSASLGAGRPAGGDARGRGRSGRGSSAISSSSPARLPPSRALRAANAPPLPDLLRRSCRPRARGRRACRPPMPSGGSRVGRPTRRRAPRRARRRRPGPRARARAPRPRRAASRRPLERQDRLVYGGTRRTVYSCVAWPRNSPKVSTPGASSSYSSTRTPAYLCLWLSGIRKTSSRQTGSSVSATVAAARGRGRATARRPRRTRRRRRRRPRSG